MRGLISDIGLGRLSSILEEEISLYEKWCELSSRKKEAVINNDIDSLTRVITEERMLLVEAERLEAKRLKEISRIANELGVSENMKISDLKRYLSKEKFSVVEERASQLRNVLAKLRELNETNRYLVESTLKYISYMIDALMNSVSRATYGRKKAQASSFSFFEGEA
ncbi:MAG: flagellar protein FlgN [Synergistetes bacterium]|nr:flagellar protein FlgN [Synergistota bacterium]